MSEWISVDKMLPGVVEGMAASRAVLVYCPENECTLCATFDFDAMQWGYFGGYRGAIMEAVTYWMPLPPPPEEKP